MKIKSDFNSFMYRVIVHSKYLRLEFTHIGMSRRFQPSIIILRHRKKKLFTADKVLTNCETLDSYE